MELIKTQWEWFAFCCGFVAGIIIMTIVAYFGILGGFYVNRYIPL